MQPNPNVKVFNADIEKFARILERNVQDLLQEITRELHQRLADSTPYFTGRARASWTMANWIMDANPAPELNPPLSDPFHPTPEELRRANAFYDGIYANRRNWTIGEGVTQTWVANNVPYIDELNAGSSRQAPAGFFEANIADLENIVRASVAAVLNPF